LLQQAFTKINPLQEAGIYKSQLTLAFYPETYLFGNIVPTGTHPPNDPDELRLNGITSSLT
jgi:hypothetical protein